MVAVTGLIIGTVFHLSHKFRLILRKYHLELVLYTFIEYEERNLRPHHSKRS